MKTIIILLMIFGLYACDESTVTQPKEDTKVATQKYTLEEILADTNWVEITDTIYYPTSKLFGYSFLYIDWELNTLKIINSTSEYNDIEFKSDTSSMNYIKNNLNWNIDFNEKSMIGIKIDISRREMVLRKLFINNKIKQYQYFAIDTDPIRQLDGEQDYNFIIIPKLKNDYIITGDYLYIRGYK